MRLNVGVIFGGPSVEHEISIISATEIMGYFNEDKYNVIPIYIDKEGSWYTGSHLKDIIHYRDIDLVKRYAKRVALVRDGKRVVLQTLGLLKRDIFVIDIVMPIGHGTFMEDGSLQGYLDMLKIPYVGSKVLGSALGQDKIIQKEIFAYNDLPVTKFLYFNFKEFVNEKQKVINKVSETLKYPVYIKPASLGSSIGISKIEKEANLLDALKEAFKFGNKVIVEESVKNVREVNISVLGNYYNQETSEIEEINSSSEFYTFKEKYVDNYSKTIKKGKTSNPIISKELLGDLKNYAIKAFKILNCSGVARIDFLLDDKEKKVYINEINTMPGSLSGYLWLAKKKPQSELIDNLIELAIKEEKNKENITFFFPNNLLEKFDILKGKKLKKDDKTK